ncbi:CRISPR-associated endonuclease Cas3'' [Comamonas sp. NLF-1-9]|uniref:CRISPR-associated endonuclease Cas3'' n=1 Tax=Comamonas sp. NLF-1-9 TaxID=2853163 RepID=UPI001C45E591|nr:CRISPR-associated endonuclease Cas3'' [Comamonas sp. NLF-1-9]QXL83987.1 CRISPR-associated endonuclease Cas3'' [Comamonas sp. NLF-1-9]
MTEYWAHSGGHPLAEHLQSVAERAQRFAAALGREQSLSSWARLAGKWHDLGKYRPGFQRHVRQVEDAHIEHKVAGREKTHSAAGALWAIQCLGQAHGDRGKLMARVLAYLIAGHHAGLANWEGDLEVRLSQADSAQELQEALDAQPPRAILDAGDFVPDLRAIPGGQDGFALWLRMLFSCLVDADFLDTEAHFDAGRARRATSCMPKPAPMSHQSCARKQCVAIGMQ